MATPTSPLTILTAAPWSNGYGTYTQPVPVAPVSLNATTISSAQINVGLPTAPSSAVQTEWSYKPSANPNWIVWSTTAAATTTQQIIGLGAAISYDFRARYSNQTGFGAYSATSTATTQSTSSIVDGGNFAIVGSGFGTNTNVGQLFLGGVNGVIESIANGTPCRNLLGAGWTYPGNSDSIVRNTRSYSGTKSLVNDNVTNSNFQFGMVFNTGGRYFSHYMRYNIYVYNPDLINPLQLKITRRSGSISGPSGSGGLGDDDNPDCYLTRFTGGIGPGFVNNGGSSGTIGPSQGGGVVGGWFVDNVWCTIEEIFYPGTVGNSDGIWQWRCVRLDTGAVISSGTVPGQNFWANAYAANPYRYFAMQGYFGNWNGTSINAALFWDRDFYSAWNTTSATAPKFLLLTNASTYNASTTFSICTYTAWSDTVIQAVINKGPHASLSGLYWYPMSGINTPISNTGIPLQ